ncbi:cell envelope integrity protein TolA [Undibacterium sp. TJN25]|uniref:cell envelope integrity protein TolA n=1 Tax=Undibacterium sp. TJN25 TaxID=3413056 RepID=UPI003BF52B73
MPAIALALLMHALLFTFLWFGVQWQNQESTAVEAEVWDMQTREVAPKPVPQEEVIPEPVKVQPPPPAVIPDEPKADPEIALEQERKRKLAEKKKEEEKLKLEREQARVQAERDDELRKQKEKEKEKLKLAEDKKKADKLAAEDADKKKQDELKKKQASDQVARDKVFAENMRRLNGQAATTGSGGNGDAPRSTGNNRGDPSYAAKVIAKIRSNSSYNSSDNSGNNPTVEYRIDLLPDGTLRGAIRKLKSSGLPGFDEAVERAIDKSQPFPKNNSGVVPDSMIVVYKLKE